MRVKRVWITGHSKCRSPLLFSSFDDISLKKYGQFAITPISFWRSITWVKAWNFEQTVTAVRRWFHSRLSHNTWQYRAFVCGIFQDSLAWQVSSPSPPFHNNSLSDCFSVTSPAVCTLVRCTVPLVACVERYFACVLLISKNTMTECHKCRKLVYFGEFSYLTTPFMAGFPKIIRFASKREHRAQSTVAHWSS